MNKQIPAWATTGATVYARSQASGRIGRSATLRKGEVSRITATSVFVKVPRYDGEIEEIRYTLQGWRGLAAYGTKDDFYLRTLVAEQEGLDEIAAIEAREQANQVRNTARSAAEAVANSLSRERAEAAIEALQAYLEQGE